MKKIFVLIFLILAGCTGLQDRMSDSQNRILELREGVGDDLGDDIINDLKDILEIEMLGNNQGLISFKANNTKDLLIECSVLLSLNNTLYEIGLGIFHPNEEKTVESAVGFNNGESKFDLIIKCNQPKNMEKCVLKESIYMQYFCLALLNQDVSFCDKISSNVSNMRMIWCKAFILDQPEFCEDIVDNNDKDWCYLDIGMNKANKKACDMTMDIKRKNSCMAVVESNPDLCFDGEDGSIPICLENTAKAMNDITVCDKLSELGSRNECRNHLSYLQ